MIVPEQPRSERRTASSLCLRIRPTLIIWATAISVIDTNDHRQTPEKFLSNGRPLRNEETGMASGELLDRPLAEMCDKSRLLDLIRNFIIFDGGQKKVPRPHQYTGVKMAQERIAKREGGVIWHT